MILNFAYDSSVNGAPAGFTTALNNVKAFFQATFSDPITVNINVGWGEVGGTAMPAGALGASETAIARYSWSQVKSALTADARTAIDSSAVASLPATDPTNGGGITVATAEAKALGLSNASGSDGAVGFAATSYDFDNSNGITAGQVDFFGVAAHEISEVMGRFLMFDSGAETVMDLFHFSAPGTRSSTAGGYFSADNGASSLGAFNAIKGGDFGDWAASVGADSFLASAPAGVMLPVSANDIKAMDAIGWDASSTSPADTTPPVLASTSPVDNATNVPVGANLVLTFSESVKAGAGNVIIHKSSDGSAVASISAGDASQVSFAGSTVTINPASDLAWGTHYYVTIDGGAIQDLAGNAFAGISSNSALDWTTATPTAIETAGVTELATSANHYYLLDNSGAGPSLKYNGADVTTGEFGSWNPIGAEHTASGYEIAWKDNGSGLFTLWSTDANGNWLANLALGISGTSPTLVSAETLFHQDLNGDGVIGSGGSSGPAMTPIETAGATELATSANHYYLLDSSGAGPSLKYNGADVTAGEFGSWNPIGAEQTASGYEIAWKDSGSGLFTLWSTDANGNWLANLALGISGTSPTLISAESLFHQDLNGDGVIGSGGSSGPAMAPIETAGATELATSANHYYLLDSTGAGPSLKYAGADVTTGEFGSWNPIGAEQTASGYEIAWKDSSSGLFSLWSTDSNGNFVSNGNNAEYSASDPTLISAETLFHQDLNGDGVIGVKGTAIASGGNMLAEPSGPGGIGDNHEIHLLGIDTIHLAAALQ